MKSAWNQCGTRSPWVCNLTVTINNEKKPFNDARVRRALTLAIHRGSIEGAVADLGDEVRRRLLRPGSEFAIPESELVKLAGFGKNIEASRKEARQLLKEAGVPEGFSFTLKNRERERALRSDRRLRH